MARLSDGEILGLTAWGEARGDVDQATHLSLVERIGVMCVVRNRLPRYTEFRAAEKTYRAVCLAPNQFSCWSIAGGRLNFAAVTREAAALLKTGQSDDLILTETLFLAEGILNGAIQDVTGGATAYYAPAAMIPMDSVPTWAQGKTGLDLGSQRFFRV